MTIISVDTTLGDVVTRHPSLARTLEKLGLDYCCGGERTLGEACATKGLDPSQVVAGLAADATDDDPAAWAAMGIVQLVDHIEATHHRFLHEELPRVSDLLTKIRGVHGDRHPELVTVQATFEALRADLEPHLRNEELLVFPAIRALAVATTAPPDGPGRLDRPMSVLRDEHDQAGALLARLRLLTDGFRVPDDGCASYRATFDALAAIEADTHLHVHKENNVLFPAVDRVEHRLLRHSA